MKEKFIGEGSFGCVLYPGKKCKNNKYINKSIAKIFKDKKYYIDELLTHMKIEKIFETNKKCIVNILDHCEKKLDIYQKKNYSKCDSTYQSDDQIIYQILFEYGGQDLYIIADYNKKIKFKEIFFSLSNIFESIILLNSKELIHFDIRLPNILYNNNSTKLIDFGLLLKYDEIESEFMNSSRFEYPPELNIYNYNNLCDFNIHIEESIILNKYPKYEILLLEFKKYFDKIKEKFSNSNNIYKKNPIIKNKIDIYMLGTSIFELLRCLFETPGRVDLNIIELRNILNLAHNMTHYDNNIRLSDVNAYSYYKDIVNKMQKKTKNSAIKNSAIKNSAIKNSAIKNSAIKNSDIKNSVIKNSAIKNNVMKNSVMKNSVMKNSVMKNSVMKNSVIKNMEITFPLKK